MTKPHAYEGMHRRRVEYDTGVVRLCEGDASVGSFMVARVGTDQVFWAQLITWLISGHGLKDVVNRGLDLEGRPPEAQSAALPRHYRGRVRA